jgi:hypothetical protein
MARETIFGRCVAASFRDRVNTFLTINRTCLDPKRAPDGQDRFGHGRRFTPTYIPIQTKIFVGVKLVFTLCEVWIPKPQYKSKSLRSIS